VTGPWRTRRLGPLVVRYRRRSRPEFVAFDEALAAFGRYLLTIPPGSWIDHLVWWLNGKLGGPSKSELASELASDDAPQTPEEAR
jgi:hypothetical protein